MPPDIARPVPQDLATLIAHARIAALRALTDILATSEDPKERRHAATAILRIPDPKPEPPLPPAPPPTTSAPAPNDERRTRLNAVRTRAMQEVERSLESLVDRNTPEQLADLLDLAFPPGGRTPMRPRQSEAATLADTAGARPPT